MTLQQRAAQVLIVAIDPDAPLDSRSESLLAEGLGGVILHPGTEVDRATVAGAIRRMRDAAEVPILVTVDQEGGRVLRLTGEGFTPIPSAKDQGALAPKELRAQAKEWGQELHEAGVDVDLAPVADVVPADNAASNDPIAKLGRGFGSNPERVSSSAGAFIRGLADSEVGSTLKHFPGLGRVKANTDDAAAVDEVTTLDDPLLAPFYDQLDVAEMVMVSSATYTKIDDENLATFSPIVMKALRDKGFAGVIVSDDVGAAAALADIKPGERAVRFLQAGGDVVLTVEPATAQTMIDAIADEASSDQAFSAALTQHVERMLALKAKHGLVLCE